MQEVKITSADINDEQLKRLYRRCEDIEAKERNAIV